MNSKFLYEKPFFLDQAGVQWVMDTLDAMSVDEKIEQLFCVEIRAGETEKIEKITVQHKAGAVMCLPGEKQELYDLIADLQKKSRIPMLVGGNFEEGADAIKGATNIDNNLGIAATGDVFYAEQLGEITAKEGTAIGFNWAFAPVIDIGMNWRNPVIATRVYGAKAKQVSAFSVKQILAMQSHGMAATMKHFPGDGVDERDQHFSPTINSLSCEEWNRSFGKVYKDCIDAGALAVMVGHILQPAWQKAI